MTTKILAVVALCVLLAACEPAANETKPAASPVAQTASTPMPGPSPEPSVATVAWKAGDKVKVTINGSTVEATVVSIDETLGKATVKVQGETKERTVSLSDIVKQ